MYDTRKCVTPDHLLRGQAEFALNEIGKSNHNHDVIMFSSYPIGLIPENQEIKIMPIGQNSVYEKILFIFNYNKYK